VRTALVVDDHAAFRAAARRMLERAGYAVVAEASSGQEALHAAAAHRPDLVLLDVGLPDLDGFAVAARLAAAGAPSAVVLVSAREPEDFGPLVARAAARAFVPKRALTPRVLDAVLA